MQEKPLKQRRMKIWQKSDKDGNINGYSPEQLWISNNKICFTNDGWTTTKAVFGKVLVDGKESYGSE